jgi:aminopeptidase N
MRGKGNEYFKAWDEQTAQIHNEDIKNRSAERKAEMQKKFTEIKMSYTEASESFKPFLSDLKDIQTALATDLTTGGVKAIKGAADKANKDAVPLKASIEKLAGQFKDLGTAMAAAAPPPAAASAK